MSNRIKIGDRVVHYRHGVGIVKSFNYQGMAKVCFEYSTHYVESKNLTSIEEISQFADNRSKAFIILRKILKDDFSQADSFYKASCIDYISTEEYEQEKASFLEALHREAEQQERIKQEKLRREVEAKCTELLIALRKVLKDDFLQADSVFIASFSDNISVKDYEQEKALFTQHWVKETTSTELDMEQAAAVASIHGHIQVIARAGSGKTTTLVNRALFLQKHCGVAPDEILLLAFNRKAAEEIAERLRKVLDNCVPHVMTFHALAYAIVHPEESLLYNGPPGESQVLSQAFQQVIDDHLQIPAFKTEIRELMLAHFRADWDRIIKGGYDKSKEELLQFRRSLPRKSLRGEYVKSFGEKVIADFLFEHDIPYKYERNHWWNGINYRPDFTIFKTEKSGVIIEYFGLEGDPDYDKMSQAKRGYWSQKSGWILLEVSPQDIISDDIENFEKFLKESLEKQGIKCRRLSEDELWHRIRDRAIDRFTTACVNFVGRCRKRWLTPDELDELIASHVTLSDIESMFIKIARKLYQAYLDRLMATGEEDFDGLMQRATEIVSSGITLFERKVGRGDIRKLHYVFIDEFQDFSELFYRLIVAMQKQNPHIELFCVGDDWQAINGFAGSDLRFFQGFENHFGQSHKLYISTNYRSSQSIVNIGNALMQGLGKPAIAQKQSIGQALLADLSKFEPSLLEKQRHLGDIITPAVLRLVSKNLADSLDVLLLSRRNALPWFVNYQDQEGANIQGLERYLTFIRTFFPKDIRERITISTTHKCKGLEKTMVIVLDAVARSYPLVHPDWIFSRILGDSLEKFVTEERRLFYVALTRAVEKLVIITDQGAFSPFLEDIQCKEKIQAVDWEDYPPISGKTSRFVVKVGNQEFKGTSPTFAIKDGLKATGYQWQTTGWKGWAKSFPADNFTIKVLQEEIWVAAADGIEIRIFDDHDILVARYSVNAGQWNCVFDKMLHE